MKLKVSVLVVAVVLLAGGAMLLGYQQYHAFPGVWNLLSFIIAAYLLDRTGNDLRFDAKGSTSFV
ncbi:MAG: hypothetical protein JNM53_12705, partial [Gemmatimonadetes bacterium]|nr:hypothetical protein [Gemmatimonadota bacterium]